MTLLQLNVFVGWLCVHVGMAREIALHIVQVHGSSSYVHVHVLYIIAHLSVLPCPNLVCSHV